MARFVGDYGRLPTFDETLAFRAALDDRVAAYLSRHPDLSTSTRASQFTFHRRAAVGMTRDEVTLLLGAPSVRTDDVASDGDGRPPVLARRRPERAGDVDLPRRMVSLLRRRSPGRHHGDRQAAAVARMTKAMRPVADLAPRLLRSFGAPADAALDAPGNRGTRPRRGPRGDRDRGHRRDRRRAHVRQGQRVGLGDGSRSRRRRTRAAAHRADPRLWMGRRHRGSAPRMVAHRRQCPSRESARAELSHVAGREPAVDGPRRPTS